MCLTASRHGRRRIGLGGAASGAGHTRSEKHECLGWRCIDSGGAIAGRAGHTRADECLVWRRICGGAAAGGAGHTRAEKHELPRMAAHLW